MDARTSAALADALATLDDGPAPAAVGRGAGLVAVAGGRRAARAAAAAAAAGGARAALVLGEPPRLVCFGPRPPAAVLRAAAAAAAADLEAAGEADAARRCAEAFFGAPVV